MFLTVIIAILYILRHKIIKSWEIAYRIVKIENTIIKPIVTNHALFAVVTFSRIKSFAYVNSILIQHL